MLVCRVVLALFPLCLLTTGLERSSDEQAPAGVSAGTASISGTVTNMAAGEPIAGVEVALYGQVLAGRRLSTSSDEQGRFAFRDLVSGRYTVGAAKPGFASVLHGQRRIGAPGRPWRLAAGEHRDFRLQLPRLGAISGTVLDDDGEPLSRASVRAWRYTMSSGHRRAIEAGGATPDRDGRYRIGGLTPGDYAVCASSRQTAPLDAAQRLRREIDRLRRNATFTLGPAGIAAQQQVAPQLAELEARLPAHVEPVSGYLPSCHPDSMKEPSMVSVGVEESRAGVNFTLSSTRLARIEGRVNAARPVTPQVGPIFLYNADDRLQGGFIESARPDLDGHFFLPDVAPGRYVVMLHTDSEGRPQGPRVAAAVEVTVADQDMSNVVLEIQRSATVSGQVVFEGVSAPDAALLAQLQVRLDTTGQGPMARHAGLSVAPVDAAGRFVLRDVFPGEYRLGAYVKAPTPWFIEGATVSGRDARDQPLTIASGQRITNAVVTMTNRRATVSGTILTGQGEPANDYWILVYASDERDRAVHAGRLRGSRAADDGTFTIPGFRAGSYRVATFLEGEFGDWFAPEFLRRLERDSAPLPIADGEQKTLNLRVPDDR